MRLLAIVNYLENATSDISYQSEVGREQQLYVISNEFFGYVLSDENELTLRIGFQNIGGMPVAKSKKSLPRQGISKLQFDIFGIAEVNIDWQLMEQGKKLHARTKECWEHLYISYDHNKTSPAWNTKQYGGIALFSIGSAAHRVTEKSMGRWA